MDRDNLRDIQRLQRSRPGGRARVMLFGEYAGGEQGEGQRGEVVSDPYYGGSAGFEKVYEQVRRFSQNFLREAFPGAEGASERGRGC